MELSLKISLGKFYKFTHDDIFHLDGIDTLENTAAEKVIFYWTG